MIIENLTTLEVHKLSQEQYEREFAAGNLVEGAWYLIPDNSSEEFIALQQRVEALERLLSNLQIAEETSF